ncbi:MAG: YggS family pyridoxal phosphate-dependent enzyme [Anaerolineaceae bacterium]|nr:YggS family pyridoxal phosphate-dependent enzyme [Anaerolineaceae bacterium]
MDSREIALIKTKIEQNLAEILEIVSRAAAVSGRDADEIRVLAISKRQPVEVIEAAYRCGQLAFGESYVQEALPKTEYFHQYADIRWDMVGHIQSRKARQVAENFHAVHSVDSLKLADLLNKFRPAELPPLEVFLEVNIGDEDSKSGFQGSDHDDWAALLTVVRKILKMDRLNLGGLMAMPPLFLDPEASRPYFQKLRKLRDYLSSEVMEAKLSQLSAGTSADFEIAIEEGATIVRIGERLLGPRA